MNTIASVVALKPPFFARLLRSLTVANADSMGSVVLIEAQCAAEKS
ncbi:hypothetical protein ACZ87_03216 [Candidatus Erwinia dacicola]|uniref:Uncharacterized protein n=1 Tax=Candidatus Erwinia dacicola TaxID=252393 RepID=A0A328TQ97_9GAMM|nr:hypothetical protein ACZ87_03216 [Candidatus Erwinia dacicola]